jgi:Cu(I)/Ag(I) efflux system membrane fusion protein
MSKSIMDITSSDDIEFQREAFSRLTEGLITSIKYFGLTVEKVYYQYCPMAFNNKGDFWLSTSDKVLNPYFGERMLNCGEVVEIIEF